MALESVLNVSLSYEDSRGVAIPEVGVTNAKKTATASQRRPARIVQNVATSEEALNLGDLSGTTIFCAYIRNLDPTNYVQVRTATAGTAFCRLPPDTNQDGTNFCLVLPWESGITAPFVIANEAACDIEIFLVPN